MFNLFGSGISKEDKARKELIRRYKDSRTAIDQFHVMAAKKALSFAKVSHGNLHFLMSPLGADIVAYAPETKIFLGGHTSRALLRYGEFVDVDDPTMPLEDVKTATFRSENSLDSVVRKVCSSPFFTKRDIKMRDNYFVWDQVPLSWVHGIAVKKNRQLVAHAAPGAIRELTELPGKLYECLLDGKSLSGDFAMMEIHIIYAKDEIQSETTTSRLLFSYQDLPASRSAKNQNYIETIANPIMPFLRSLTLGMRECQYEDYILASSAGWMRNPEPTSSPLNDDLPF